MTENITSFFANLNKCFIHQIKEWTEIVIDLETANKYQILSEQQGEIGFAAELAGGFGTTIGRLILRKHRSMNISIWDNTKAVMLDIGRPFYFFFSDMCVKDANGTILGHVNKQFGIINKKYVLCDELMKPFAWVKSPIWRLWTFPVLDHTEKEIGVITKKWGGVLKEAFTDADKFQVAFPHQFNDKQKALLLACAISIDLDHFENKGRN